MQRRVADFADVMRRDARRHADRDAGSAVGQQVGKIRREDDRFLVFAAIGVAEIDGILVDAFEQRHRNLGHPRFRVTHRRRVIAVDIAKVTLAVDQGIADREFLRQAHQRVVNRLVAVGVVLPHHVADDAGALLEPLLGIQTQLAHREQQPAMHRLEAIAHVGQRARHDRRYGVTQIALAQRVLERLFAYGPSGGTCHYNPL